MAGRLPRALGRAHESTYQHPSGIVPGPGHLDPLATKKPISTDKLIEKMLVDFPMKFTGTLGTVGEGGKEAGLAVGERDAGHVLNLPGMSDSTFRAFR